jgi:hypothetical protein
MTTKGYFLYGSDDEMMMVIRGYDENLMLSIISKLKKSREQDIKNLAEILENHFYDRDNDRRSTSKTRSENKKTGGRSIRSRNTKIKNTKPIAERST